MKTKLALALAACTLTSQAVTIDITRHDLTTLSFIVRDRTTPGFFPLRDEVTINGYTSIVGISANTIGNNTVQVALNWVHPSSPLSDTFIIPPGLLIFPTFDGSSYRLDLATYDWEWTYTVNAPGNGGGTGVPDNGSALVALGAALVVLWRFKR